MGYQKQTLITPTEAGYNHSYPSSVMTSWQVLASVLRGWNVIFLSVGAGSSSPSTDVETFSTNSSTWTLLVHWGNASSERILTASDGESIKCTALWTASKTASIQISVARWRSWEISRPSEETSPKIFSQSYVTKGCKRLILVKGS